jgi:large-conductance mechanosensitive channel
MATAAKTSLTLPIALIIGPAIAIILSLFVYAIVNFIFSGYADTSGTDSGTSISSGAGVASEDSGISIFKTITNVILFIVSAVSVMSFAPCLVFGIIILNKRRRAREVPEVARQRTWEDIA